MLPLPPRPPAYSLVNEDDNEPPPAYSTISDNDNLNSSISEDDDISVKLVDFPYNKKINHYCTLTFCISPLYFAGTYILSLILFATCVPTNRLQPCNFEGKMELADAWALKYNISDTQNKIDEITNVLRFELSSEASKSLIQKRISINETVKELKQKFSYQKVEWEKCYIKNYNNNHKNRCFFMLICGCGLPFVIVFLFAKMYYYIRKVPVHALNEEETKSFKVTVSNNIHCIGLLFIIVCAAVVVVPKLDKMEEPETLPLFVAESWRDFCHGGPAITVEQYLNPGNF